MKQAVKLTSLILRSSKHFNPRPQIIHRFCSFNACKLWLCSWPIFHCLQVQHMNIFFTFLVTRSHLFKEALPGLIAQPFVVHHRLQPGRNFKGFFSLISRAIISNTIGNFYQRVNTHYISRTKGGRLWATYDGTCQRIHFINTQP